MMTPVQKLAGLVLLILVLMAGAAGTTWQVQDWRMGKKLAEQASLHNDDLAAITNAAASQARAEQDRRIATEQALATADQQHTKELSDAQRNQVALRDRLATADVRLSVLLDATDSGSGYNVPTAPAPPAWFMQPVEPNLTQRMLKELSPSPTQEIKD